MQTKIISEFFLKNHIFSAWDLSQAVIYWTFENVIHFGLEP